MRHAAGTALRLRIECRRRDEVALRFTAHGSQGAAWEHPIIGHIGPQAREAHWGGVRIFRFADGKVAETWVYSDSLTMLQQLGALANLVQAAG